MGLRYYLSLYGTYFRLVARIHFHYRADFGIMAVSTTIREGATLLFLSVIFGTITQLQGWGFYELVLVYGLFVASAYVSTVFLNMPHSIQWYVQQGEFDVMLVRPPRPLFQMFGANCLDLTQVGSLIAGIVITIVA